MPAERDSDRGQDTSKHLVIGGLLPRKRFRMPAGIPRPARLTTAVRRRQEIRKRIPETSSRVPFRRKRRRRTQRTPRRNHKDERRRQGALPSERHAENSPRYRRRQSPRSPKRRSAFRIGKTTARTRRTAPPEPKDREPARRCRPETSERSTKGPDKRSERKSGEKSVPESIVPEPKNRYRCEERTAPSGVREKRTDAPGRVSAPSAPYAPAGTLTRRSARARYSADSCWPD